MRGGSFKTKWCDFNIVPRCGWYKYIHSPTATFKTKEDLSSNWQSYSTHDSETKQRKTASSSDLQGVWLGRVRVKLSRRKNVLDGPTKQWIFFIILKNILYRKQLICITIESSEERLLQNQGVTVNKRMGVFLGTWPISLFVWCVATSLLCYLWVQNSKRDNR